MNLRMTESESVALPLGYTPVIGFRKPVVPEFLKGAILLILQAFFQLLVE